MKGYKFRTEEMALNLGGIRSNTSESNKFDDLGFVAWKEKGEMVETKLAEKAMNINDDRETSVTQKVKALRKLFKKKGFKIIFKRAK